MIPKGELLHDIESEEELVALKENLFNIKNDLEIKANRKIEILNAADFFIFYIYSDVPQGNSLNRCLVKYILDNNPHKIVLLPIYISEMDHHVKKLSENIHSFDLKKIEKMKNDEKIVKPFIKAWEGRQKSDTFTFESLIMKFKTVYDYYPKELTYICLIKDFNYYFVEPVNILKDYLLHSKNVLPLKNIKRTLSLKVIQFDLEVWKEAFYILSVRNKFRSDMNDSEAISTCSWINKFSAKRYYVRHLTDKFAYNTLKKINMDTPSGIKRPLCRNVHTLAIETMLFLMYKNKLKEISEVIDTDIREIDKYFDTPPNEQHKRFMIQQKLRERYYLKLVEICSDFNKKNKNNTNALNQIMKHISSGASFGNGMGDSLSKHYEVTLRHINNIIEFLFDCNEVLLKKMKGEFKQVTEDMMKQFYNAVIEKFDPTQKLKPEFELINSHTKKIHNQFAAYFQSIKNELQEKTSKTINEFFEKGNFDISELESCLDRFRELCIEDWQRQELILNCENIKSIAQQKEFFELAAFIRDFLGKITN